MDIYHIWCALKPGVSDADFSKSLIAYLDYLKSDGRLEHYRITRRKLGLGHPALPDWHIMLDFKGLAQLDDAFGQVASRAGVPEELHQAVNSKVAEVSFALYRDFPDSVRKHGEERF